MSNKKRGHQGRADRFKSSSGPEDVQGFTEVDLENTESPEIENTPEISIETLSEQAEQLVAETLDDGEAKAQEVLDKIGEIENPVDQAALESELEAAQNEFNGEITTSASEILADFRKYKEELKELKETRIKEEKTKRIEILQKHLDDKNIQEQHDLDIEKSKITERVEKMEDGSSEKGRLLAKVNKIDKQLEDLTQAREDIKKLSLADLRKKTKNDPMTITGFEKENTEEGVTNPSLTEIRDALEGGEISTEGLVDDTQPAGAEILDTGTETSLESEDLRQQLIDLNWQKQLDLRDKRHGVKKQSEGLRSNSQGKNDLLKEIKEMDRQMEELAKESQVIKKLSLDDLRNRAKNELVSSTTSTEELLKTPSKSFVEEGSEEAKFLDEIQPKKTDSSSLSDDKKPEVLSEPAIEEDAVEKEAEELVNTSFASLNPEDDLPNGQEKDIELEDDSQSDTLDPFSDFQVLESDRLWYVSMAEMKPEKKEVVLRFLKQKHKEYDDRLSNGQDIINSEYKKKLVEMFVASESVTMDSFLTNVRRSFHDEVDYPAVENAWNVVTDYIETGGDKVVGGTGFGERHIEPDSNLGEEKKEVEPVLEVPLEIPLTNKRNVSLFAKLTKGAQQVFSGIYERSQIRKQSIGILDSRLVITEIKDSIEDQKQELDSLDEQISLLEQQITTIDATYENVGVEFVSEKEKASLQAEKSKLQAEIDQLESKKETLPEIIENSQEEIDKLESRLESIVDNFLKTVNEKTEPYQQEIIALESARNGLEDRKANFKEAIVEFQSSLEKIHEQVSGLDESNLSDESKKTFHSALTRKIRGIEKSLSLADSEIYLLTNKLGQLDFKIEREKRKMSKWVNMNELISTSQIETSDEAESPEVINQEVESTINTNSSETIPEPSLDSAETDQELSEEESENIDDQEEREAHTFPVEDYVKSWNDLAVIDSDLSVDMADFLSDGEVYKNLNQVEGKVMAFVLQSKVEEESKKHGRANFGWLWSEKGKFEKNLKSKITPLAKSLRDQIKK